MKYTFKTNINCGGCIAKVQPFMDGEENIQSWEVNTDVPEKILRVESETWQAGQIMDLVKKAGFEIEERKKGLLQRLIGRS